MDPPTNSLSTGETKEGKDSENFERSSEADFSLFNDVFRNDLIGNKIASYLNLADLKDASASCRALYEMVRKSQNFSAIAKLCLNRTNMEQGQDLNFGPGCSASGSENHAETTETFLGFSVIEVDLAMSSKILKFLQENKNFLKKVQTVSLVETGTDDEVTEAAAMLHYIFANTSVVTLQMNRNVALRFKLEDHFNTQSGTEYFAKLRNLEIYFSTLPLNLQRLEIGKVGYNFEPYGNIVDLILDLGSIQDLVLDFKVTSPWRNAQFGNIRLPLLKKLAISLTDGKEDIENFIVFMKNLPLLEELSLCVMKECDQSLLTVIQERGSKLKKLHIRAKRFGDGKKVNWGFLADMKNLTDFALVRPKSNDEITPNCEGTGVSFLKSLPTSLKHLKLGGISFFWWDTDQNTGTGELEKQSLVNRFPDLITLSITHYGGEGFNENFLDKVNTSMSKLQKLELSDLDETTDSGLDEGAPVNLANLKGLTQV